MRKITATLIALSLAACTTPETIMKNEKTGQITRCGGNTSSSIMLGAIGYSLQKSSDSECVASYAEQGFKRIPSSPPPTQ